ncbi:MAG: hypothetical protein BGO67_05315 [Alphaproteobacteria bacterium 41-28]|nr:MAG: hypothetical protein BGO67_05315 [Alphaproteobacteria bacterium 41-28]
MFIVYIKSGDEIVSRQRHTRIGIDLLKLIARHGYRIFDLNTARGLAPQVGIQDSYLPQVLTYLKQDRWIFPLRNGVYALDVAFLGDIPLHEHEIAMNLLTPSAISHFSALQYHGLTDQVPFVTYLSTPSSVKIPRLSKKTPQGCLINGLLYKIIKVPDTSFFGFVETWESSSKILYTDREKSLLDGLTSPQYCGGLSEVLHAFESHVGQIDIKKIIEYSLRLSIATSKRLGWALEEVGVPPEKLKPLLKRSIKSYTNLDSHQESSGSYNRKWMIRENL